MMTASNDPDRIDSQRGFAQAVRDLMQASAAAGCRQIWCADPDFALWPLGERAVVDALNRWVQGHRRLVLLARHFDELPRRHARWVAWRQPWGHNVVCRQLAEDVAPVVPCALLAEPCGALSLDSVDPWRGRLQRDPQDLARLRHQLEALESAGSDGFPATTLGL